MVDAAHGVSPLLFTVLGKKRRRKREGSQAVRRAIMFGCGVRWDTRVLRLPDGHRHGIIDGPRGAKAQGTLRPQGGVLPAFAHLLSQSLACVRGSSGEKPLALALAETTELTMPDRPRAVILVSLVNSRAGSAGGRSQAAPIFHRC